MEHIASVLSMQWHTASMLSIRDVQEKLRMECAIFGILDNAWEQIHQCEIHMQ